ncbi:MAG: hypothetical protein WC655_17705 [Candidatus Hydrogenedentales bacterium]|jgi:hypothetical protein
MAIRIGIGLCLLLMATGCPVLSLQPLYESTDELVSRPDLLGKWIENEGDENVIEFVAVNDTSYRMIAREGDENLEFDVAIVEIRGQLFMDLLLEEPSGDAAMYSQNLHQFWAIDLSKDTLAVKALAGDWAKERSEKGRLWVRHVRIDDKTILTAKPSRLQRFVHKWGKDPEAFAEMFILHRVPPSKGDAKPSGQ